MLRISPLCLRNVGPPSVRCSNVWKGSPWQTTNKSSMPGWTSRRTTGGSKCTNWFSCCTRKASSLTSLSACSPSVAQRDCRRGHTAECTPDSTTYGMSTVTGAETWIVFLVPPRGFASICSLFILLLVLCFSDWRFGLETIWCEFVWNHDMTITMLFLFVVWTIFPGYFYQIWTTLWLSLCVLHVY